MVTRTVFSGGKELERALLELSTKSTQKVGRAALRATARPIAKKAKAIVRKRSGDVAKGITVRVDRMRNNHALFSALIYVSNGSGKNKKGFRPRKTDRKSKVKGVLLPPQYDYQIGSKPSVYANFLEYGRHKQGIRAYPFMRPAWDSDGGRVAQGRLGDELWAGLSKEAARLAKGL